MLSKNTFSGTVVLPGGEGFSTKNAFGIPTGKEIFSLYIETVIDNVQDIVHKKNGHDIVQ